ncbi:hypothetical protein BC939DRAFT_46023 [Gamsiella multidivaricata]|uniref:uncharacterized protein n=1 Tax=Gamsiella multidivaricata TaxID=101098 RepID=UPI00221F2EB7|nr:uncharacterized protein BC939DRAFT_46023 [Gamsiella multidivaricata]KAI7816366.1 hypothetical protein BC939DRAFT_46023 [Gamsiella multidivaricata]
MSAAENNSSAFRTNPTAHSPPNSPSTSRSLNLPEPPSPIQPTSSNSLADADSGEAPLSYALTRPPKKLRPPVSIFDLPCPPTAAPPQDNDEFSSHLDALEKMLEEEDTGAIPTGLEIGPQILVESLNKKRVRSLVTQGQTDLSSSLSSEGSGPIANDLTQDTDQILFVDTAPPSSILPAHKKVHFAPGLDNEQENKAEPILVVIADGDAIDTTDDKEAGLKRDRDVDQKVEQAPKPNKEPRLSPPQSASSNEPSNSSASAAVGRNKKGKEPVRSVASMIGSRRKPVAAHSSAASRSSVPTARTPGSTSRTSAAQRTAPSVITLDEDERVGPDRTDEKAIPEASSAPPIPKSTGETKPTSSPLSSLKLYVIPTQMDKVVFSTMCERVLQLRGEWLGPKTKVLATDPRVKPDIPALDQENTTHIVTALSNIEAVKRFLNVSEINRSRLSIENGYPILLCTRGPWSRNRMSSRGPKSQCTSAHLNRILHLLLRPI